MGNWPPRQNPSQESSDMSDNDIYPEEPQDTVDLTEDDVEGHGLKEVAAGLGAAAVLAGGAAGATALAGTHSDVHMSKGGPGISVQVQDPIGTAVQASDQAISDAQHLRDSTIASTQRTAASTTSAVDRTVDSATGLADRTVDWTGDVAQAAGTAVKAEKAAVTKIAKTTATSVSNAVPTRAEIDQTVQQTAATAATTAHTADRKVATVLNVTTTTATGGVHTAVVTVRAVNAGAGVESSGAGGWVLVKAGDQVLAQVHMTGGSATASWTMPLVGGHAVTISYTGDSVFAPSLRAITL